MKDRLDKVMLYLNLVKTRSQASMLIEQGDVFVDGVQALKSGVKVDSEALIEIKERTLYVGRGAYKLEAALLHFKVNPKDLIVADVGASTGGFTQVLLDAGAACVYAIDVGTDQLSPIIKNDSRVVDMPGVNIKFPLTLPVKVDLVVVDLSFISLRLVLDNILNLLNEKGMGIFLIKPQFEAGVKRLGKGGIVKSEEIREEVLLEVVKFMSEKVSYISEPILSPIVGKQGNIEYLIFVKL